ncbi:MAG: hypothetical protein V4622_12885 [Bacteroidota bacterium]
MKINKLVAVALLFSTTTFGQNLQNAIRNTDNERFAEADKEFKQLISLDPANGCLYFYTGENFAAQGELDSANYYWRKASEKDPNVALSFVALGKSMWIKGEETQAREQFTKALTMTKNKNAEVVRNIAKVYITSEKKSLDEAIKLLELAIKLDAKNEDAYLLMGDAMYEKTPENGSNAIKNYNKVLEINPKSPRGIVRVAKLYQRAQSYELANEKYQEAQAVDPTYAPAYRENAELNLKFNQAKKAQENWKKYLELNNSVEARYRYATAMFIGKQYCEVITELESLKQNGFDNFYVERMLTYSYAECTTDKEAAAKGLVASEAYFKMVPTDKVIFLDYKYKGLLLVNAGKDSLAIIELEKASAIDEAAKKELAGQIAKMYMKTKNYPKVIENYEYKLSTSSLTAAENLELGRAYYFGPKNYALADSAFSRLIVASPTYAPAYLWKARAVFQFDLKNEKWLAQAPYQKVVELVKPEERATGSNKSMVMEAAKYLGDYYYSSAAKDITKAKEYWTIVQTLDPADAQAKAFFAKNK